MLATLKVLLAVALVGVGLPSGAQTRTGGINSGPEAFTGAPGPASPSSAWEIYDAGPGLAADALLAARGPVPGGGAVVENIPAAEAARIQNAANRIGKPIHVVGSRASGTARPNSDWDFVIEANHHTRASAAKSLPGARNVQEGLTTPGAQDVFKGPLDPSKPHVTFSPEVPR